MRNNLGDATAVRPADEDSVLDRESVQERQKLVSVDLKIVNAPRRAARGVAVADAIVTSDPVACGDELFGKRTKS